MIREQKNNTNCSMGKKMGFANGMKAGGIMSMYNVMYFVCCFYIFYFIFAFAFCEAHNVYCSLDWNLI